MAVITKEVCYHCGDECSSKLLLKDEKNFCCNGCLNVYSILAAGNLQNYYKLNNYPGASQKKEIQAFDYLNIPEITAKLVNYQDTDKTIVTLYLPAIHCSSCIWLLEHLNKLDAGVTESRVDFLKKQIYLQFNHNHTKLQQIAQLLTSIGYEPLISLQDVVNNDVSKKDRLIPKIAVAGFCFGNVMLLAFPAYFGIAPSERHFGEFFSLLSLAFCIPAVFYSGLDYFKRAYVSLKQGVLNIDFPLALGIAVLLIRTIADYVFNVGEGFADTLTGLVFFLLIGKLVQQKTYHHLSFERDYRSFFPVAVDVINENGEIIPIALENIKEGDRISVKNQEIIPADAILLNGNALIDFSFVTGESKPIQKVLGEIIYAGGRQTAGSLELEVIKPVSQSYLTGLWNNESFQKANDNKTKTFVTKVSHYFSIILLSLATLTLLFWLPYSWQTGLNAFTAILIIACPCALALSTPFTMGAALSIFDKNKFYLKNTDVVEQLAAIDTIVFDKTGTVTLADNNSIEFIGNVLNGLESNIIYSICKNSSHPLSRKICGFLNTSKVIAIEDFKEIPGKGMHTIYQGYEIFIGSTSFVPHASTRLVDFPQVHININGEYLGYFKINQKLRPQLGELMLSLSTNYQTYLISGDGNQDNSLLKHYFKSESHLLYQQSPQDKLDFIAKQQRNDAKVLMIGDGLNDAGALQQSNSGIAVTDNINNFTPGSDAILDGTSFHLLPDFLKFSKATVNIIHLSFCIAVCYNIIGISFAIQGKLSPLIAAILMPLSTVTIILFTSISTHIQAKKHNLIS
ncbi:heavy metal translocating P-type ATPase [Pedobacter arcticus]|uniref:heavy metal translocating P-type ATPase n=1 Tax=Pedobacter arcticus TaxID=752140 RepID=UPI0002DBE36F|nr:heavy metal translocating P-type ATPase metal-binding domain-containing protein [Pedobacter arcticus]